MHTLSRRRDEVASVREWLRLVASGCGEEASVRGWLRLKCEWLHALAASVAWRSARERKRSVRRG
jgi:hypothetical protein